MSEPQKNTNADSSAAEQTASLEGGGATRDFAPTPPTPRPSASNVQVPGYEMLGVLGRGGMGVVYKAKQAKANRLVALKMILAGSHADQSDRLRFKAEAEAAARLSHPNIVQLYEVGETPEGFPFFSLEYVSGGTLAERLKQSPLRPVEAATLVESLARAMQYAHEHGIIHRDLKPLNILLEGSRVATGGETMVRDRATRTVNSPDSSFSVDVSRALIPKISDFGLAKQLDSEDGLTRTGAIMGSPAYMAPEQAFGQSKRVGPAADIYALGAILYECLTGRPPFKGATVADTLEQVRTMEPITLKAFAKEIPRDLETICLHCLHKDPARRYASAEALADDLRRYLDNKPITVRPVGIVERGVRWCRRNPKSACAVGTIVALLLTITFGSVYSAAAMANLNTKILEESGEKEKQRKDAIEARDLANKKKKEAEEARDDADKKKKLAEARGVQALKAVTLFTTDARVFCEDALVPGESRKMLYDVLIKELESQVDQAPGEATLDALRNKAMLYQTLCSVTHDLGQFETSEKWFTKGIAVVDDWQMALPPDDPTPLPFRAKLLNIRGESLKRQDKLAAARELLVESEAIRRKLVGDPSIDTMKKADTISDLADSLDSLERFDEAIELRQQVLLSSKGMGDALVKELTEATVAKVGYEEAKRKLRDFGQRLFPYRHALCSTYQKAGLHATEYAKRKEYLTEANKLSRVLNQDRPSNRKVLADWALSEKMCGELEYSHGKIAEKANKTDDAEKHFDAAKTHYDQLKFVTAKLANSDQLLNGLRDYGRSFYTLGLAVERKNPTKARDYFHTSRLIRERIAYDYKQSALSFDLELDLYFSQIALGEIKEIMHKFRHDGTILMVAAEATTSYRGACLYALAIQKIEERRKDGVQTPTDMRDMIEYRDSAIRLLQQAHDKGFTDFFQSNIDADLDAIRADPRMKEFEATHRYQRGVLAKKRDEKAARVEFEASQALAAQWIDKFTANHERYGLVKCVWLCGHVQLGKAADAIETADRLRPKLRDTQARLYLARVYALATRAITDAKLKERCRDDALALIDEAKEFATEARLTAETDFDPIRSEPRFIELVERAKNPPKK